jgi:acyl-CoA thioester hydrolase
MGVAYHGHYLVWFEVGRTELMRQLGCTYAELEEQDGIFFPVIEVGARYHAPARYDQRLVVSTQLDAVQGVRVRFAYRVTRQEGNALLATGYTVHAAVGRDGRAMRLPRELKLRLLGKNEP